MHLIQSKESLSATSCICFNLQYYFIESTQLTGECTRKRATGRFLENEWAKWRKSIQVKFFQPVRNTPILSNYLNILVSAYYPLANEVEKGYSNATVRPSVTYL